MVVQHSVFTCRLPVPKLEDTAARYLKSVEALEGHPHINVYSIEDTKKLVNEFLKDEGLLNGPGKFCTFCVITYNISMFIISLLYF